MIKHIVMWTLKEEHQGKSKNELLTEFKTRLLDLKTRIPELLSIEVGMNEIHPDKNFDLVLVTTFQSFDELAIYANHPDHLKVVAFAKEITTGRAAVDYTI